MEGSTKSARTDLAQHLSSCRNLQTFKDQIDLFLHDEVLGHPLPPWTPEANQNVLSWVKKVIEAQDFYGATGIVRILMSYMKYESKHLNDSYFWRIFLHLNRFGNVLEFDAVDFHVLQEFWSSLFDMCHILTDRFPDIEEDVFCIICKGIFDVVFESSALIFLRQIRLKELNKMLAISPTFSRTVFRDKHPYEFKMLRSLLETAGDYDYQTSVVEAIFRMSTIKERTECVAKWFPQFSCRTQSLFIRIAEFDPDVRRFLNAFNENMGKSRLVHSFACTSAQIGHLKLKKPQVPTYEKLWVDFNYGTMTIFLLCENFREEESSDDSQWENIRILTSEVEEVILTRAVEVFTLNITLISVEFVSKMLSMELPREVAKKPSAKIITLEFRPSNELQDTLSKMFLSKFKVFERNLEGWREQSEEEKCSVTRSLKGSSSSSGKRKKQSYNSWHHKATEAGPTAPKKFCRGPTTGHTKSSSSVSSIKSERVIDTWSGHGESVTATVQVPSLAKPPKAYAKHSFVSTTTCIISSEEKHFPAAREENVPCSQNSSGKNLKASERPNTKASYQKMKLTEAVEEEEEEEPIKDFSKLGADEGNITHHNLKDTYSSQLQGTPDFDTSTQEAAILNKALDSVEAQTKLHVKEKVALKESAAVVDNMGKETTESSNEIIPCSLGSQERILPGQPPKLLNLSKKKEATLALARSPEISDKQSGVDKEPKPNTFANINTNVKKDRESVGTNKAPSGENCDHQRKSKEEMPDVSRGGNVAKTDSPIMTPSSTDKRYKRSQKKVESKTHVKKTASPKMSAASTGKHKRKSQLKIESPKMSAASTGKHKRKSQLKIESKPHVKKTDLPVVFASSAGNHKGLRKNIKSKPVANILTSPKKYPLRNRLKISCQEKQQQSAVGIAKSPSPRPKCSRGQSSRVAAKRLQAKVVVPFPALEFTSPFSKSNIKTASWASMSSPSVSTPNLSPIMPVTPHQDTALSKTSRPNTPFPDTVKAKSPGSERSRRDQPVQTTNRVVEAWQETSRTDESLQAVSRNDKSLHKPLRKDKSSQDSCKPALSLQEASKKDDSLQDTSKKDENMQETSRKNKSLQETSENKSLQETLGKDKFLQDSSKHDSSLQEASKQGVFLQETSRSNNSLQESSRNDTVCQEASNNDEYVQEMPTDDKSLHETSRSYKSLPNTYRADTSLQKLSNNNESLQNFSANVESCQETSKSDRSFQDSPRNDAVSLQELCQGDESKQEAFMNDKSCQKISSNDMSMQGTCKHVASAQENSKDISVQDEHGNEKSVKETFTSEKSLPEDSRNDSPMSKPLRMDSPPLQHSAQKIVESSPALPNTDSLKFTKDPPVTPKLLANVYDSIRISPKSPSSLAETPQLPLDYRTLKSAVLLSASPVPERLVVDAHKPSVSAIPEILPVITTEPDLIVSECTISKQSVKQSHSVSYPDVESENANPLPASPKSNVPCISEPCLPIKDINSQGNEQAVNPVLLDPCDTQSRTTVLKEHLPRSDGEHASHVTEENSILYNTSLGELSISPILKPTNQAEASCGTQVKSKSVPEQKIEKSKTETKDISVLLPSSECDSHVLQNEFENTVEVHTVGENEVFASQNTELSDDDEIFIKRKPDPKKDQEASILPLLVNKRSPSKSLLSSMKILADYPVQPQGLATPSKRTCEAFVRKQGSKSVVSEGSEHKAKKQKRPQSYSYPPLGRRAHEVSPLSVAAERKRVANRISKSKKKLYDTSAMSMLEGSPPDTGHIRDIADNHSSHEEIPSLHSENECKTGKSVHSKKQSESVGNSDEMYSSKSLDITPRKGIDKVSPSSAKSSAKRIFKSRNITNLSDDDDKGLKQKKSKPDDPEVNISKYKKRNVSKIPKDKGKKRSTDKSSKKSKAVGGFLEYPELEEEKCKHHSVYSDLDSSGAETEHSWLYRNKGQRKKKTNEVSHTYENKRKSNSKGMLAKGSSDDAWEPFKERRRKSRPKPQKPFVDSESDKSVKERAKRGSKSRNCKRVSSYLEDSSLTEMETDMEPQKSRFKSSSYWVDNVANKKDSPEVLRNTSKSSVEMDSGVVVNNFSLSAVRTKDYKCKSIEKDIAENFGFSSPEMLDDLPAIDEQPPKRVRKSVEDTNIKGILKEMLPVQQKNQQKHRVKPKLLLDSVDVGGVPDPPDNTPNTPAAAHVYTHDVTESFEILDVSGCEISVEMPNLKLNSDRPLQGTLLHEAADGHAAGPRFSYVSEAEVSFTADKSQNLSKSRVESNNSTSDIDRNYHSPCATADVQSPDFEASSSFEGIERIEMIPQHPWSSADDDSEQSEKINDAEGVAEKDMGMTVTKGISLAKEHLIDDSPLFTEKINSDMQFYGESTSPAVQNVSSSPLVAQNISQELFQEDSFTSPSVPLLLNHSDVQEAVKSTVPNESSCKSTPVCQGSGEDQIILQGSCTNTSTLLSSLLNRLTNKAFGDNSSTPTASFDGVATPVQICPRILFAAQKKTQGTEQNSETGDAAATNLNKNLVEALQCLQNSETADAAATNLNKNLVEALQCLQNAAEEAKLSLVKLSDAIGMLMHLLTNKNDLL